MQGVPSDTLTCRCRFCACTFSYAISEAGCEARCPNCRQSILLPGKLQQITIRKRERVNSLTNLSLEIGGFILLVFFPWGTMIGIPLIWIGWRKAAKLRCGNCEAILKNKNSARCPVCKAAFASE
jgi:hypothetical protein